MSKPSHRCVENHEKSREKPTGRAEINVSKSGVLWAIEYLPQLLSNSVHLSKHVGQENQSMDWEIPKFYECNLWGTM